MTDLTPKKFKELSVLMASAPPETAARLLAMFERMQLQGSRAIPSGELIAAMREAGMTSVAGAVFDSVRLPSFSRLFFEPFEGLFENGPMEQMLPGSLPRTGLAEVWRLVAGHFAPEDISELEPLANAAILRGDIDTAREFADKFRSLVLINLEGFPNEAIAKLALTPEAKAVLLRFVPILTAQSRGRDVWAKAFGAKGELSEHGVQLLCEKARALAVQNIEAARELLVLTMATLPRPCEAIRILNKLSGGVDDSRLAEGHFSIIGRRVLAIAHKAAGMIEEAAETGTYGGAALAATIDRYNQNLHGLEREAHLAIDGPWRTEIVSIRQVVDGGFKAICQRVTVNLETALPLQHVKSRSGRWSREPKLQQRLDDDSIKMAIEGLVFIASTRLLAPLAGFGAPREVASRHVTGYLDTLCEGLLRASRLADKSENLASWVKSTVRVVSAFEGEKAASVFERRANVAAGTKFAA